MSLQRHSLHHDTAVTHFLRLHSKRLAFIVRRSWLVGTNSVLMCRKARSEVWYSADAGELAQIAPTQKA